MYIINSMALGEVLVPVRVLEKNRGHSKLGHLGEILSFTKRCSVFEKKRITEGTSVCQG